MRVTRPEDSRVARKSDAIFAPVACLGAKMNTALLVTMRIRLVERAPLLHAVFLLPHLSASRSMVRRVLTLLRMKVVISPIPIFLRFKDGAISEDMPDALTVVTLHVIAVVPGRLHGDAGANDWLGVGAAQMVVDVHGVKVCTMCQVSSNPNPSSRNL